MDTKLHKSVRYGDIDGVVAALKDKFDPNAMGVLQWTPVHEAARTGEKDILFYLLAHGGSPNKPDGLSTRNTPLHLAALEGHIDCIRLLLTHKGNATLLNAEGKTCLEVAPPEHREKIAQLIMEFGDVADEQNNNERKMIRRPLPTDTDKWITLPEVPKHAEMGYLHLSFEYHKGVLKVRVWQISDLLLPPPQISMIHSIFVRGYFMPDSVRKTLRRTEEIILDAPEKDGPVENPKTGIQHIFTPSSFKFRTPLTYAGVTSEIVKERSLQLEVCMTQKRSQRVFLMAMVHMPLRTAVRRPIREKYPLIPCMNVTIPNNMRVYSAVDLQLESSLRDYYRNGIVAAPKERESSSGFPYSATSLTPKEEELDDSVSISAEEFLRSHLSLCLDDSEEEEDEGVLGESNNSGRLREVYVDNGVGSSGASSSTTLDVPSCDEDENVDVSIVISSSQLDKSPDSSSLDIEPRSEQKGVKKKIIPYELLHENESFEVGLDLSAEHTVLDTDSFSEHFSEQEVHKNKSQTSKTVNKRKIIPSEFLSPTSALNTDALGDDSYTAMEEGEMLSGGFVYSQRHILESENNTGVPDKPPRRKKILVSPGDISIPVDCAYTGSQSTLCVSSGSEGLSPHESLSPDSGASLPGMLVLDDSAFNPASRPETPCWDFYDLSQDLQAGDLDHEVIGQTLEESLEQLRQLGDGSLQHLSGPPMLPMDLVDDFDTLAVDSDGTDDTTEDKQEN